MEILSTMQMWAYIISGVTLIACISSVLFFLIGSLILFLAGEDVNNL